MQMRLANERAKRGGAPKPAWPVLRILGHRPRALLRSGNRNLRLSSQPLEDVAPSAREDVVGNASSGAFRILDVDRRMPTDQVRTAWIGDERVEDETSAFRHREHADGNLATAFHLRETCALRPHGDTSRCVVQRREQLAHSGVVIAGLHGDRALPRGGKPRGRIENLVHALMDAESIEPGDGENGGVHLPVVDFAEARWHVAAEIDHLEIGSPREQQRATSQARGSDATPARKLIDRPGAERVVDDERIARILALEDGGDQYALWRFGGKILQGMHAAFDLPRSQRMLQLLGEQSLRTDRAQGLIDALVARGLEGDELGLHIVRAERGLDLSRLPQRQLRCARADANYVSVPGQSRVDSMRSRSQAACSGTK